MSITLAQMRRKVGQLWDGRPFYVASTASGGSATSLEDAPVLKDQFRSDYRRGSWVLRPDKSDSDKERVISIDDHENGILVPSAAWTDAIVSTDPYELYSLQPSQIEDAINRGLGRIRIREEIDLSGVSGQVQYSMAAYTWLLTDEQVIGFKVRSGTSGAYYWTTVPNVAFTSDQDALALNLNGLTFGTDDSLRLVATRSAASLGSVVPLAAGTDTVPLANDDEMLSWIAYEAILDLLDAPISRQMAPDVDSRLDALKANVTKQLTRYRNRFLPRRSSYSVWASGGTFGPSGRGI